MRKVYCDRCHRWIKEICKNSISDKNNCNEPITWLDCIIILLDEFDLCDFCKDQLIKLWQHSIKLADRNDTIKEDFKNEKNDTEKA